MTSRLRTENSFQPSWKERVWRSVWWVGMEPKYFTTAALCCILQLIKSTANWRQQLVYADKSAAWKVQQKPAVHDQSLCLPLLNHVRRTTSFYKVTPINTTVMAHRMEGPKYRTQGLLRKKKSKSLIDRLKAIHRRSVNRANKSDMKQAKRQSQKPR